MTLTVTGQLLTDILTAITSLCSKTDTVVTELGYIKNGVSYSSGASTLYGVVSSMAATQVSQLSWESKVGGCVSGNKIQTKEVA